MRQLKKILMMAGGTGGHIFPALAVAEKMREEGIEVHWLGTKTGLESQFVTEAGFPLHVISVGAIRGRKLIERFLQLFRLSIAIFQAGKIIKQLKPDVVVGMGGFVSGPGGIASVILRKPLVIHEQNAKPGITNRWLGKVAKKVLVGFAHTFPPSKKTIFVGNPVRLELMQVLPLEKRFNRHESALRLLVMGGSLGALALNQMLPAALAQINAEERPIILHQTGNKHFEQTKEIYRAHGVQANLVPFIKEMKQAYSDADIVICRAGALTIAELCATGLGAILIPYPYAVDDHQTANGQEMERAGAAILLQEKDLTINQLADLLKNLTTQRDICLNMAMAAYKLRKTDVIDKMISVFRGVCP